MNPKKKNKIKKSSVIFNPDCFQIKYSILAQIATSFGTHSYILQNNYSWFWI